jgi:hypothetical protein
MDLDVEGKPVLKYICNGVNSIFHNNLLST